MTKRPTAPIDQRVKRWNQLIATRASFQVESIRILESNVFAAQTIHLDRIVAFIGLHGTGKSLLLRMIEASFGFASSGYMPPFLPGPRSSHIKSLVPPLQGVVEISIRTSSECVSRTVDLGESDESRAQIWKQVFGESFAAWYTDPAGVFSELDYMNQNYDFNDEPLASEEERELNRADLDALRNIIGRGYDRVTVRDGNIPTIETPFILARSGSKLFDNTTMSQGELWVHYINWFMDYQKDRGHLALIDEPESFLAAAGRRPFIDHIACLALRNDRQVLIGTHSPEILSRFPLANVRICVPDDSGNRIITPSSLIEIYDSVGIQTSIRAIALVEDELAKQILTAIFARYDTALTREVEIIPVGGASEVRIGSRILEKANRLACFPIFDGDQRQAGGNDKSSVMTSYFLPGVERPEDELTKSAIEQINWLSDMIGVHADRIVVAINSCRYLDHQYHLGKIAEQLGYREEMLTQMFINAWLRQCDVTQEAERLARDIRNGLSRPS